MRFFALDESKAWAEKFFLIYAIVWISYFAILITFDLYENASRLTWMMFGVVMVVPLVLYPVIFPGKADKQVPVLQRFWVKANVWIWIFGFVGNYLWTHYFYTILGAYYTLETYRINNVPWLMFFATQAYFTFYHSVTNVLQRVIYTCMPEKSWKRTFVIIAFVIGFSYFTAFMETFTIQKFPYYVIEDRYKMYVYGSVFYGLYFIVSFPMFFRIDEDVTKRKWSLSRVAIDAFAAAMIVTLLLDFWRLCIGSIRPQSRDTGIPWLQN